MLLYMYIDDVKLHLNIIRGGLVIYGLNVCTHVFVGYVPCLMVMRCPSFVRLQIVQMVLAVMFHLVALRIQYSW